MLTEIAFKYYTLCSNFTLGKWSLLRLTRIREIVEMRLRNQSLMNLRILYLFIDSHELEDAAAGYSGQKAARILPKRLALQ